MDLVHVQFDKDTGNIVLGNTESKPQGGGGKQYYGTYGYWWSQSVESDTWVINHGGNTSKLMAQVCDSNNRVVIPQQIEISSPNTVTIRFGAPMSGSAAITLFILF